MLVEGHNRFYSEVPDTNTPEPSEEDGPALSGDETLKEWGMTVR